jgi:hypothetical protein
MTDLRLFNAPNSTTYTPCTGCLAAEAAAAAGSLPSEIQLEVLRQVLVCSDELAFTHLPLSKKELANHNKSRTLHIYGYKRFSGTLRLAR